MQEVEWVKFESFRSKIGEVSKTPMGEWIARVFIGEHVYKINELFISAEAGMKTIERVWERQGKK